VVLWRKMENKTRKHRECEQTSYCVAWKLIKHWCRWSPITKQQPFITLSLSLRCFMSLALSGYRSYFTYIPSVLLSVHRDDETVERDTCLMFSHPVIPPNVLRDPCFRKNLPLIPSCSSIQFDLENKLSVRLGKIFNKNSSIFLCTVWIIVRCYLRTLARD